MFAYYSFIVSLFVAAATLWMRALIVAGKARREDLEERLGKSVPTVFQTGRGVVINAVSVGEVAEAESLIIALHHQIPEIEVVVTTGNRDGRNRAEQIGRRTGAAVYSTLLPWDRRRTIRRWLTRLNPAVVVTLEAEIWPNLFHACSDLNIPLLIASGRIYNRDVWRYKLARRFFAKVLASATSIGVQSMAEQERFLSIGAPPEKVYVGGDLKFDSLPSATGSESKFRFLRNAGGPLLVAGSTHEPEEKMMLALFASIRDDISGLRLILAPRHVSRCSRLLEVVQEDGFQVARWSDPESMQHRWDVLLLDEVGWLPHIYQFGDLAIIGGTFASYGGHNPVEPALAGIPIVAGPHTDHFTETFQKLSERNAAVLTRNTHDLHRAVLTLLSNPVIGKEIGERGKHLVEELRGSAAAYVRLILDRLPSPPPLVKPEPVARQ